MKSFKANINSKFCMINTFVLSLILVFVFSFSSASFGQSPEELFKQGNKFYQSGQFESSVESYEKILSQGYESSSLYFNLGNAYFKEGKLGYAVLNYEKGLKLSPGNEDLAYNLKIANARTVDKITEVPQLFIINWWEMLITLFSVAGWSLIVLIIYLIFLSSIGLYLLSKKFQIQKLAFLAGSTSLSIFIVAVIILVSRYNHEASSNYGVLLETNYAVKIAPDFKSNDAFLINEGIKFLVEDKVSDWYKIRLVDGKVGWVQRNSFAQI